MMMIIAIIACLISLGLIIQMFVAFAKLNKVIKSFDRIFSPEVRKGKNFKEKGLTF